MWSFVENLLFVKQRLLDEPIVINQQNLKYINSLRNPKLKFNLYQTYDVVNHPLNVTSITFEKPEKDDDIPCCSHFLSDQRAVKKFAIIRNKEKNFMFDENVVLYHVVLQDGIIRNVINKDLSQVQQKMLAHHE
jgi:hypothetical protein